MKTLAIKINTYGSGVKIINNNNLEKRILNFMLLSLVVLAMCYAVFLVNTVYNIVERQNFSKQEKMLSNEVGELELTYLSMSNKIDMNLATTLGFKESKKEYAARKSFSSLSNVKLAKNEI